MTMLRAVDFDGTPRAVRCTAKKRFALAVRTDDAFRVVYRTDKADSSLRLRAFREAKAANGHVFVFSLLTGRLLALVTARKGYYKITEAGDGNDLTKATVHNIT